MADRYESEGERRIAQFLKKRGIEFTHQKPIAIRHGEKLSLWYPDFYLDDFNIVIEYFGMVVKEEYVKAMKYKQAIFHKEKIDFISVYPEMIKMKDFELFLWEKIKNIIYYKIKMWEKGGHGSGRTTRSNLNRSNGNETTERNYSKSSGRGGTRKKYSRPNNKGNTKRSYDKNKYKENYNKDKK